MRTMPVGSRAWASAISSAAANVRKGPLTSALYQAPASVNRTCRVVRSRSEVPKLVSRFLMDLETVDDGTLK